MGRSQVIKSLILSWLGTVFIIAGIVVMVTVSLAGFWLFLFAIGFSIWRLTQMGMSAESDCEAGITTFLGILFIVILPFDALILTSRLISRRYGDVGMEGLKRTSQKEKVTRPVTQSQTDSAPLSAVKKVVPRTQHKAAFSPMFMVTTAFVKDYEFEPKEQKQEIKKEAIKLDLTNKQQEEIKSLILDTVQNDGYKVNQALISKNYSLKGISQTLKLISGEIHDDLKNLVRFNQGITESKRLEILRDKYEFYRSSRNLKRYSKFASNSIGLYVWYKLNLDKNTSIEEIEEIRSNLISYIELDIKYWGEAITQPTLLKTSDEVKRYMYGSIFVLYSFLNELLEDVPDNAKKEEIHNKRGLYFEMSKFNDLSLLQEDISMDKFDMKNLEMYMNDLRGIKDIKEKEKQIRGLAEAISSKFLDDRERHDLTIVSRDQGRGIAYRFAALKAFYEKYRTDKFAEFYAKGLYDAMHVYSGDIEVGSYFHYCFCQLKILRDKHSKSMEILKHYGYALSKVSWYFTHHNRNRKDYALPEESNPYDFIETQIANQEIRNLIVQYPDYLDLQKSLEIALDNVLINLDRKSMRGHAEELRKDAEEELEKIKEENYLPEKKTIPKYLKKVDLNKFFGILNKTFGAEIEKWTENEIRVWRRVRIGQFNLSILPNEEFGGETLVALTLYLLRIDINKFKNLMN